jgi:ABC-type lipoprotein export system ATPase subunit
LREITISSGAEFIRTDLHIHSFGQDGSYDVTDTEMVPERIVDEAIKYNLGIISITDHNEIANSLKAIKYSENKPVFIIPGIEICTIQGHLLAYFETYNDLSKFYKKLSISDDKKRCNEGLERCLSFIQENNGIGIMAHIDLSSGFEQTIGRFNRVMEDIFCHQALFALEISKNDGINIYTDEDNKEERKTLINLRRKCLSQQPNIILPKVMFSDAHKFENFGKNASGNFKLTRFKIEEKSLQALKIALTNYESRVRIEESIPEKIPHFVGMTIDGGLLDKQDIKFSKNLTCIIGGRGTGKSTLLESLRVSSGNASDNKLVDCEIWPNEINLKYIDDTGYVSEFQRLKGGNVENITDASFGLEKIPIESFGQGETSIALQESDDQPSNLLRFLDNFINIKVLQKEDEELCELLVANRMELQKLRMELLSESEYSRTLKDLENKKSRLERDKVGELVKYHTSLQTERNLRRKLGESLNNLIKTYKSTLGDVKEFNSICDLDDKNIIVGKNEYKQVKGIINDFSKTVEEKNNEISTILNEKIILIKDIMQKWKNRETEIYDNIEKTKQELANQGIPIDIVRINKLAEDLETYRDKMKKCEQAKEKLVIAEEKRNQLIERRKEIRRNIFKERFSFARKLNNNLKNSVEGLFVKIDFNEGCFSFEFEDCLKKAMGWHTTQVNKAKYIASKMSPLLFSLYVKKNMTNIFKSTVNKERIYLSNSDIKQIFDIINENKNYEEFESLSFEDKPSINITKEIVDENGLNKHSTKPISQLSLGQQQSILLAILLQSRSNNPLLIDQPEDNLDSEFIYKTIVKNLRQIKEKRQVIIITHNANIAVLGDAELIIPLKSSSVKSYLQNPGSIDCANIINSCCEILEGGRQAFIDRQKIYGIQG